MGKCINIKKYCSRRCGEMFVYLKKRDKILQMAREKRKANPIIKKFQPCKRICKFCGKEFITKQTNQIYCSKECCGNKYKEDYKKINQGIILNDRSGKHYNYCKLRFEVFKRDNFTCQYCGRNVKDDKIKINTDHIIPRSKRGKDTFNNLTTSCSECNAGKDDVLLELNAKKRMKKFLKIGDLKLTDKR